MKMARASDKDREAVKDFLSIMEQLGQYESALIGEDDWEPDDEQLGGWVREWFEKHSAAMSRVVWGFEVLFENCCDPTADVLEWKPEILAKLEPAT